MSIEHLSDDLAAIWENLCWEQRMLTRFNHLEVTKTSAPQSLFFTVDIILSSCEGTEIHVWSGDSERIEGNYEEWLGEIRDRLVAIAQSLTADPPACVASELTVSRSRTDRILRHLQRKQVNLDLIGQDLRSRLPDNVNIDIFPEMTALGSYFFILRARKFVGDTPVSYCRIDIPLQEVINPQTYNHCIGVAAEQIIRSLNNLELYDSYERLGVCTLNELTALTNGISIQTAAPGLQFHNPGDPETWVDETCPFNASSSHLRCAVNPSGPCQGCRERGRNGY